MAWDSDPSDSEFDSWELKMAEGMEPSEAARQVGVESRGAPFTCSAFKRRDVARHGQALTMSREARAFFADRQAEDWVMAEDASPHLRALWLKRWNPNYRERHEVQVTGADGGVLEVQVVHDEERATALAGKLVELGFRVGAAAAAGRSDEVGAAGMGALPAA